MITDHIYQSDYAGLDPAKQICTHQRAEDMMTCGHLRAEHSSFVGSWTSNAEG